MITPLFFVIGLIVGSFLNSVVYRIEKKESVWHGRSYCPHCRQTLSWFELIPLMSFIFQKGRCRHCQKRIAWQYPLIELISGTLFALLYYSPAWLVNRSFLEPELFLWLAISSCLIVLFVYDFKHSIIPNAVVYTGIVIALVGKFILSLLGIDSWLAFSQAILAASLAGSFFLSLVLMSRGRWMGVGDVKLAILIGLTLSWPLAVVALWLSFILGAIASLFLLSIGLKKLKSTIPFGPFMITATWLTLLGGPILLNWLF